MRNSQLTTHNSQLEKGFTFVEVIIATFVFVLIMTTLSVIFSSALKSLRSGKAIQKDLEGAQQAMNIIAKTLRTSKVVDPDIPTLNASSITVYDYSQADFVDPVDGPNKECIKYEFSGNSLKSGAVTAANEDACAAASVTTANMTTGTVTGNFYVDPSTKDLAGKITIAVKVCPPNGCTGNPKDEAKVQSTVSLRNEYEELAP